MASGTGEKRACLRHGWANTAHVTATTWMVTAVGGWACARARVCACVGGCVRAYMRRVTWGKKPPWCKKPLLDIHKSKLDRKAYTTIV